MLDASEDLEGHAPDRCVDSACAMRTFASTRVRRDEEVSTAAGPVTGVGPVQMPLQAKITYPRLRGGRTPSRPAFVSCYPRGITFGATVGARSPEGRAWFRRYWESSVDVPFTLTVDERPGRRSKSSTARDVARRWSGRCLGAKRGRSPGRSPLRGTRRARRP